MKSSKVEVLKRVEEVFKLRLGGAEFADIREYAEAPERAWGVSDSQLWRYVREADALMKERVDAKADHLLARHILQRRNLYAHAVGAGDHRTALAVLKDEAELERLYDRDVLPQLPEADGPGGSRPAVEGTGDVVKVLAGRLAQVDAADLPAGEKVRLTAALADSLLRALGVDVMAKRLEALEAVLLARGKKK